MPKLGTQSPSSAQLLEQRTPHAAAEPSAPRAPWLTPVVLPAMVVLLVATVLIYVFAAR
ncbi:hypothetical protein [Nannocystis punicea]|uniref:Uncharacterized protein n=1 Tax=Nannocystis punicea TaxID=2995304 RepID=A0ABY7HDT4_9BACT|nr:hypothetical protein [Nannocystis poenicansa]WAS97439.1 hypothetical protein O0S08_14930 [Nannocystis poenicansa]